jgi:hypothetical protein
MHLPIRELVQIFMGYVILSLFKGKLRTEETLEEVVFEKFSAIIYMSERQ